MPKLSNTVSVDQELGLLKSSDSIKKCKEIQFRQCGRILSTGTVSIILIVYVVDN